MRNVQLVSLQFAGQRKAQEYIVYPVQNGDRSELRFQSDKACGVVLLSTGFCKYQAKSPYFVMLAAPDAKTFIMDPESLKALLAAQPKSGDTMGGGVVTLA
jgi:hypothetical protein